MYASLEELQLRVRDAFVRRLFSESIASFHAGSLRGATVTLWTAVVFDIIAELRELELSGDAQAAVHLRAFETARQRNDIDSALQFERDILATARDQFELVTHQEHDDLARLQADRHRCAHPSMNSADEAYMPSAELVRYHLTSAAQHLFVRPPVQGKAALQRLFDDVKSPYFPRRVPDAARVLQGGPLGSAKPALVRNFVVASLKASLIGPDAADPNRSTPILVALAATNSFLAADVTAVIRDAFPRIAQQVPPDAVGRILRLAAAVTSVLDFVTDDVVGRLEGYIGETPEQELNPALLVALSHPRFEAAARAKLGQLKRPELIALVSQNPARAARSREVVARVVSEYCASRSWDTSNSLGPSAVAPLAESIEWPAVERILKAVAVNVELTHAFTTNEVLTKLRDSHPDHSQQFQSVGDQLKLGEHFPDLFPGSAPDTAQEESAGGDEEPPF